MKSIGSLVPFAQLILTFFGPSVAPWPAGHLPVLADGPGCLPVQAVGCRLKCTVPARRRQDGLAVGQGTGRMTCPRNGVTLHYFA